MMGKSVGYDWPKRKNPLKRRHKFNVDTRLNRLAGTPRGSRLERAVYQLLLLREKAGEISCIKQQVRVHLGDGIYWNVDFSYDETVSAISMLGSGHITRTVYVEAKGVKSERYRICLKLWKGGRGPGPLEVWEGRYDRPHLKEVVKPKGLQNGE